MVKNLPAHARDVGSIPRSGRSPGVGNGVGVGNLLQYLKKKAKKKKSQKQAKNLLVNNTWLRKCEQSI